MNTQSVRFTSRLLNRLSIFASVLYLFNVSVSSSNALDEGNTVTVASCQKYPGFEQESETVLAKLHQHNITTVRLYYYGVGPDRNRTETATSKATEWQILVNKRNATEAINLIARMIANNSHITLLPEGCGDAMDFPLPVPPTPTPAKASLIQRIRRVLGL